MPTRAELLPPSSTTARACCTQAWACRLRSMAVSDTRFSAIFTTRSERPSKTKLRPSPLASTQSAVSHQVDASGRCEDRTARWSLSCTRKVTPGSACQVSPCSARRRQAMPPVSELPNTSVGEWRSSCCAWTDASADKGPPEENTPRNPFAAPAQSNCAGKRPSNAGLETSRLDGAACSSCTSSSG